MIKTNRTVIFVVFIFLFSITFSTMCGCDNGSGGGIPTNQDNGSGTVTSLCNATTASQDADVMGCGVSVAIISPVESGGKATSTDAQSVRYARLNMPFLSEAQDRNFLNVAIDFSNDELFGDYTTAEGSQSEWVIKNVPIAVFPVDYNFYFTIMDSTVTTGVDYRIRIILSENHVSSFDDLTGGTLSGTSYMEGLTELTLFEFENMVDPDPDLYGTGGRNGEITTSYDNSSGLAGKTKMEVGGVKIVVMDGVYDSPQSTNTCLLNAITNSIAWLATNFGFDVNIDISEGNATETEIAQVDLTKWDSIEGDLFLPLYWEYEEKKGLIIDKNGTVYGAHPDSMVSIKKGFVSHNNLPIETEEIKVDPQNPRDFIKQLKVRLEAGCMVELLWHLFRANGDKIGGHVVNLTGYSLGPAFGDPPAQADQNASDILVVHDANHSKTDENGAPVPQNDVYSVTINDQNEIIINNYPYGTEGTATTQLIGAIIECVDFDFTAMADGDLSVVHLKNEDSCPWFIGAITVTNTGSFAFDWYRMAMPGIKITPTGGALQPGESETLTVEFSCNPLTDINGDIIIKAVAGQAAKSISIPVSVDVQGDQVVFDLTAMADGDLSIVHQENKDSCPQFIGAITVTNTGNVAFDWYRMAMPGIKMTPTGGALQPGESETLTVEFKCDPLMDINGDIFIQAVAGQETRSIPIPVSVDFQEEQTKFEFTAIPDGELSVVHVKYEDFCPQFIGAITVTNTGNVAFDWVRMGIPGTRTTPTGGSLQPGESETLTVEFTCDPPTDINGIIDIKAVVREETKTISIPVSVDVQES